MLLNLFYILYILYWYIVEFFKYLFSPWLFGRTLLRYMLSFILFSAFFILLLKLQSFKLFPFDLIRTTPTSYLMKCTYPHQFMWRSHLILLYTIHHYLRLILYYLYHMLLRFEWSLPDNSIRPHNKY